MFYHKVSPFTFFCHHTKCSNDVGSHFDDQSIMWFLHGVKPCEVISKIVGKQKALLICMSLDAFLDITAAKI